MREMSSWVNICGIVVISFLILFLKFRCLLILELMCFADVLVIIFLELNFFLEVIVDEPAELPIAGTEVLFMICYCFCFGSLFGVVY